MLADDFSGTLSQWTTVLGNGFSIQSGELVGSGTGGDNVMINSSAATFGDGVVSSDVKNYADGSDANIVIRYQDPNNYYMVQAYASQIILFKKVAGTYYAQAVAGISPDFNGGFYHLQATVLGGTFTVYWKGLQVLTWTDGSPWVSGKVGVRQCLGRIIHWDNFSAVTYTTGIVVAYDDFYPFGMLMDGRSTVIGQPDGRYKFTGKERDVETGWDYFGARYYDSRIGRWLSVDPLAQRYSSSSPFVFSMNDPIRHYDPDGKGVKEALDKLTKGFDLRVTGGLQASVGGSVNGRRTELAVNAISTTLLSADTKKGITIMPGEASTGGALVLGGFGALVEKTLSPTTNKTSHIGTSTSISSSNSITTETSVELGFFSVGGKVTDERTLNELTGTVTQSTKKEPEVGLSKDAVVLEGALGVGVELSLSLSSVVEAWNALWQTPQQQSDANTTKPKENKKP